MQEDLKIRRQKPIVRGTLWHGDMMLIKEVLEIPTAHLGAGHATMLVTLLHILVQ